MLYDPWIQHVVFQVRRLTLDSGFHRPLRQRPGQRVACGHGLVCAKGRDIAAGVADDSQGMRQLDMLDFVCVSLLLWVVVWPVWIVWVPLYMIVELMVWSCRCLMLCIVFAIEQILQSRFECNSMRVHVQPAVSYLAFSKVIFVF